ncbi:hypothetical protein IT398_00115 [Candidatus Nomurabacteria bacterium]|nr:hypothetical protein [Candidatus Nomurabacteria bacterium]
MYFAGDLTKSSKWELLHLKEVSYWHRAGSGIQEVFNRMRASGKKHLSEMDTETIEVWVTTMLALAMQHREKKIFWLGKPKNDPPDMAVMTVTETGYFHAREIEVTRCMHPNENLIKNILKKDRENKLSEKYILCGFMEIHGHYNLVSIGNYLQTKLENIKNVVLVFNGGMIFNTDEIATRNLWTVAQISPVFDAITVNISSEYNNWLNDPDKLRYTKNGQIYFGKKTLDETYPTILPNTPISF